MDPWIRVALFHGILTGPKLSNIGRYSSIFGSAIALDLRFYYSIANTVIKN